jgi:hypothetical protein
MDAKGSVTQLLALQAHLDHGSNNFDSPYSRMVVLTVSMAAAGISLRQ